MMIDESLRVSNLFFVRVSCLQIPKFIMTQVRQQNMESQRKQNKERAVRKLLKKITIDKACDKAVTEVGGSLHSVYKETHIYEQQCNPLLVHSEFSCDHFKYHLQNTELVSHSQTNNCCVHTTY